MKVASRLLTAVLLLWICGCASNPVLTGKPQDWQGKPAADLKAAWGEPTRTIPQKDGEIWEYVKAGDFVAAAEENMRFNAGGFGGGGGFGASGAVKTTKQGERLSHYENIARFLVRDGKIRKWSAARIVDGQTVWSDN